MPNYEYPRPSLAVDCVVFGVDPPSGVSVLLITRKFGAFAGCHALPGGFVDVSDDGGQGEDLEEAALRELREEASVTLRSMFQFRTFGKPGRDPRARVVSVGYLAVVMSSCHAPLASSDASDALWVPLEVALSITLAFDHSHILGVAVRHLHTMLRPSEETETEPHQFTSAEYERLTKQGINFEI